MAEESFPMSIKLLATIFFLYFLLIELEEEDAYTTQTWVLKGKTHIIKIY